MKNLLNSLRMPGFAERQREFLQDGLHLFVLAGFAVAQPLYDLLGRNAEFFVAHRSRPADLLLLVSALSFGLPLVLVLLEGAVGLMGRLPRKVVHVFFVGLLAGVVALPALKRIGSLPGTVLLVLAGLLGALLAAAYVRFRPVRLFLTVLAPAIVLFPALFLFASPVGKLMRPVKAVAAPALGVKTAPPIVMVVFDEFSSVYLMNEKGEIDAGRYPNFAALAKDSYWFRNATTVAGGTPYAIPAMLTGRYPSGDSKIPTVDDYPQNLFTLLGNAYSMNVHETLTLLCPAELCQRGNERPAAPRSLLAEDVGYVLLHVLLPQQFTAGLPPVSQGWANFGIGSDNLGVRGALASHSDRARIFRDFIGSVRKTEKPTLHFLHVLLPHTPMMYLPSGNTYAPTWDLPVGSDHIWGDDPWRALSAEQRHLLQLQFVDRLVGELTQALKDKSLYTDSLIIVTADHGVSFVPKRPRRTIDDANYPYVMPVPLFIKLPRQEGGHVSDRNVEIIDVVPTMAEVLGVQIPWGVDGASVFDQKGLERPAKVGFGGPYRKMVKFQFAPDFPEKYEAAKQYCKYFGTGADSGGLFRVGPHRELIGGEAWPATSAKQSELIAIVDQASQLEEVDLTSGYLPVHITGYIEPSGDGATPLQLAIAINGVIRATASTFREGSRKRAFEAQVAESAVRNGRNQLDVYAITEDSQGKPHLAELSTKGQEAFRLVVDAAGGIRLISPARASIPVTPTAVQGVTEYIQTQQAMVTFSGWAADIKKQRPADQILVFAGHKQIYSGIPNLYRVDLFLGIPNPLAVDLKSLRSSGFELAVPLRSLQGLEDEQIRLFAVSHDGLATELKYDEESRALLEETLGRMAGYRLVGEEGAVHISKSDGKRFPLRGGLLRSHAEFTTLEGDRLVVSGWVVDMQDTSAPEKLVVFANGKFVSAGGVWMSREDVAAALGGSPRFVPSGFRFRLPLAKLGDLKKLDLRIFALLKNGLASELAYGEGYKYRRREPLSAENREPGETPDSATYALNYAAGRPASLTRSDGRRFPLREGLLRSHAEFTKVEGDDLVVIGWVVDMANNSVPDRLILFANGKFVHSGPVSLDREDVARSLGGNPAWARSGFQYRLPLRALGDLEALDLRIFALLKNGMASELAYGEGYRHRKRGAP